MSIFPSICNPYYLVILWVIKGSAPTLKVTVDNQRGLLENSHRRLAGYSKSSSFATRRVAMRVSLTR